MDDLRKRLLQVLDKCVVRRDEVAFLLFGQGDVEAVVDSDPHFRGNVDSPKQERFVRENQRRGRQDVEKKCPRLAQRNPLLTLGASQSMGSLNGENAWGNQLVKGLLEVLPKRLCLARVH